MDYNFDDRLLWEGVTLDKDNFINGQLRLNGIYYRYQCVEPLKLGDKIIITGTKGNILLVQKSMLGEDNEF